MTKTKNKTQAKRITIVSSSRSRVKRATPRFTNPEVPLGVAIGTIMIAGLSLMLLILPYLLDFPSEPHPGVNGIATTAPPVVSGPGYEFDCLNAVDDDGDGDVDTADTDCPSYTATPLIGSTFEYSCSDTFDNDSDGYVDTADTDCPSYTTTPLPPATTSLSPSPTSPTSTPFVMTSPNTSPSSSWWSSWYSK